MKVVRYLEEKYALMALKDQRVKVALYQDLNDPFELFSASVPDRDTRGALEYLKKDFNGRFGLLCFSKTWRNPVMWSHYADKHRGIALEFEVPDIFLIEMKYKATRHLMNLRDEMKISGRGQALVKKLTETKFRHWSYEQEMRMHVGHDETILENGLRYYEYGNDLKLLRIFIGPLCDISDNTISKALPSGKRVRAVNTRLAFKSFRVVRQKCKPERWCHGSA